MKDNTLSKLGGTCSILLGVTYIVVAVNAIDAFRRMALDPARSAAYMKGDAAVKAALTVPSALPDLDPQAWLRLGAVGLWVLVVSLLALRGGTWPKPLAYLGIAVTMVYWLIVASNFLQIQLFTAIVAGIGLVILTPLWYIWLGLRPRKAG
jgi:hypothetical protein